MLISEIRDEIITEVGGDTSDTALQDKVLGFIKSTLRRLPKNCQDRSLVAIKTATLSLAAQTATLPANFIRERELYYVDGGARKKITVIRDTEMFNERYRSDSSGRPEYCRIYGTTIEFSRPADAAYTIYIDCFQSVDSVVAGDTFAHDSSTAEIIKDGAKFYYYTYTEEKGQADSFKDLFAAGLRTLNTEYTWAETPDHIEES
jgi:hypothetical protein